MDGEDAALLLLYGVAYALGTAVAFALARTLRGRPLRPETRSSDRRAVVAVPIALILLTELATGRWRLEPGAFGTGPLTALLPCLVAGVLAGTVAGIGWRLRAPPDADDAAAWPGPIAVATAACVALAAFALFWFWPTPRARLW